MPAEPQTISILSPCSWPHLAILQRLRMRGAAEQQLLTSCVTVWLFGAVEFMLLPEVRGMMP